MTLNRENDLGRFLYAILKQLDTSKINWDTVAQDTVLRTPIRSGHAARMRYHRYRKTVDPRKTTKRKALEESSNTRVTKPKKQPKRKREDQDQDQDQDEDGERTIKAEFTPDLSILDSPYMGSPLGDFDENMLLTPRSDANCMMPYPSVVLQNIPPYEQAGCNPANLSLGSAGLDGSQTMAVPEFDSAILFQDFGGSDVGSQNTGSGWDDRGNDAMEY